MKGSANGFKRNLPGDKDPKGTDFGKLRAKAVRRSATTLTVQWKTIKDADGYMIYSNQCGKTKKMKLKKLRKQKYYKSMVVAYKLVNGKKLPIAASVTVHSTTKAKRHTIAKDLKVNKTSVVLKVGKTFRLKSKEIKQERGKVIRRHRLVSYESINTKIAKVGKKTGKIKAVGKGTTYIYAYAQDGVYKKIKVTVKKK